MKDYKLRIPDETALLIRSLHPEIKRKIKTALHLISINPQEGKALKGELDGLMSFKVSRFRVIYKVSSATIDIIAIGPRRSIYEETLRVLKKHER